FANLTIDKVGTGYTLTATSGTLTQATSNAFNITAGPPPPATHLAFGVQPSNTQVRATVTPALSVTALDAPRNTIPPFTRAASIALDNYPVCGTLTGIPSFPTRRSSDLFANLTIDKVGTGYTLTATSGTLTPATSNAFNITAAPPPPATHLAFGVQPSNTQVGATITPAVTVTALDASGNTVTSFTGAISLALGNAAGATLSGNGPVNAVNGVATFANLTIDKVGTGYTLTATSGTLTQATSNAFNITAAPPPPATHLAFGVQPSNAQVAATITPAVTLTLSLPAALPISSFTGAISLALGNAGGATLSGNGPVNAVNGVATFANLTIDKVRTGSTLTATSGTLTQATSNAFNITAAPPPPATHLAFGVQPSNAQVAATITPAVTLTLSLPAALPISSFTGAISLALGNAGGATLSGNGPVNAVNGVATF